MIKKAMIMAAGVGSRLDPLTQSTPKPLIPIANQPLMDLILNHLSSFGIKNVVANTHCLAGNIHERYADSNHTDISCNFVYEDKLSGTAGGMKKCEWFFEQGETFVVMSGDGLTGVNLEKMYESHKKSGAIVTMGLTEVPTEEVCHFGVVVTDKNNRVLEFQEKPAVENAKSNLVNTGIYMFETEIFKFIPADTFYDFAKNVFPELLANNLKMNTYALKEYWSDIGTLDQYKLSSADILKGKAVVNVPYPQTSYGWASSTSQISQGAVIKGKTIFGESTVVESKATFEGFSVIGNNCLIREGARLKNCILWDNVVIENNADLEDCIIANNTVIDKNLKVKNGSVIKAGAVISTNSEFASFVASVN